MMWYLYYDEHPELLDTTVSTNFLRARKRARTAPLTIHKINVMIDTINYLVDEDQSFFLDLPVGHQDTRDILDYINHNHIRVEQIMLH